MATFFEYVRYLQQEDERCTYLWIRLKREQFEKLH